VISTARRQTHRREVHGVSQYQSAWPRAGPHYHEGEDEWFYIEGRVSFLINGTWTDMFPGNCVYSPRGSVHAFKNNTDQPIRVFINIAPAGFERFFAEAAKEWAQPEPDMNRITTIAEKYGLHSVDP
jgi:mannose-6-phosphate isomerase-like protein (cupin superfamily)